jgi:hypothetical protein
MLEATLKLGVSRQTVLQRVKRGELEAVLVRQGRRKGLRINVVEQQPNFFSNQGQYEAGSKNERMSASTIQFLPGLILVLIKDDVNPPIRPFGKLMELQRRKVSTSIGTSRSQCATIRK